MPDPVAPLSEAVATAATGDVWLFRGRSLADRTVQAVTNSPVNHVGMAVALDDLPPLLWHAELGRTLPDVWTGERHRGVQLHRLEQAVTTWGERYGQRAWVRPLVGTLERAHEDRLMEAIDRFDGRAFPTTAGLARQWVTGRYRRSSSLETIYCAELVATTFQHMGLLPSRRPASWYDPGKFWSGDRVELTPPYALGAEVAVRWERDRLASEQAMSEPPLPEPRASDSDRERAADTLRRAAGEGRLTMEELDERVHAAYEASTRAELERLVADVVVPGAGAVQVARAQQRMPVRPGPGGTRWIVAIMGGGDRGGRWRVGERATSLNIMGGGDLDLNDAELAAERVELTVLSLMGGADIRVPEGLNVEVSDFAFMGGNDVRLGDTRPDPGGPVLHLRLISVMGGSDVKRGRKQHRGQRHLGRKWSGS